MSWLSVLVNNNSAVLKAAGTFVPGLSSAVDLFNTPAKVAATSAANPLGNKFSPARAMAMSAAMQGGRSRTDSLVTKVGIPLPGGRVAGMEHTTMIRQTDAGGGPGTGVTVQGYKGYHLNKSNQYACNPSGDRSQASVCIPKHSKWVRNRHLNAGNGRAVKRAVHRLRSFHKLAVRVEKALHIGRASSRPRRITASARVARCNCH